MRRPAPKAIAIAASLPLLTTAIGALWLHHLLDDRKKLPFSLELSPVAAQRIYSLPENTPAPPPDAPRLHEHPIIGASIPVPADLAAETRQVLSSPSTYTAVDSSCFEPGMAFSFGEGPERIDALICLLCDRAVFYRGQSQVGRHLSEEGHKQLASLYQRVFQLPPPRP